VPPQLPSCPQHCRVVYQHYKLHQTQKKLIEDGYCKAPTDDNPDDEIKINGDSPFQGTSCFAESTVNDCALCLDEVQETTKSSTHF